MLSRVKIIPREELLKHGEEDDSGTNNHMLKTKRKKCSDFMPEDGNGVLRKEMGLEWMLRPSNNIHRNSAPPENEHEATQVEEVKKTNPKELNPYLQDNGSGYPEDASYSAGSSQLLSYSVVGDGGASWRLKALKRAKEQAAHEGRTIQEVVGERWGSLQELATSVAVHRPAPGHAHFHAIKERKKGQLDMTENDDKKLIDRDYLQGVSSRHPDMKKPKKDNLHWRSKEFRRISSEDSSLVSEAVSSINKFLNDGSFMDGIINQQKKDANVCDHSLLGTKKGKNVNEKVGSESSFGEVLSSKRQSSSSNQIAAKILQLRMKGKHEEAENLSKKMNLVEDNPDTQPKAIRQEAGVSASSMRMFTCMHTPSRHPNPHPKASHTFYVAIWTETSKKCKMSQD